MILTLLVVVLEILGMLAGIVILVFGFYDRKIIKLFTLGVVVVVLSCGIAVAVLPDTPTPRPEISNEQYWYLFRW